jgi:hypothetical protein
MHHSVFVVVQHAELARLSSRQGKPINFVAALTDQIVLPQVIRSVKIKCLSKEKFSVRRRLEQSGIRERLDDFVGRRPWSVQGFDQIADADGPTMSVEETQQIQDAIDPSAA